VGEAQVQAAIEYLSDSDRCDFVPKTDGPGDADFGDACLAIQEAFIAGAEWASSFAYPPQGMNGGPIGGKQSSAPTV
jgi:hypothetical protein